jgi:steroid 5-alpha reductase family enzyme
MNFWDAYLVSSSVVFSMMTAVWLCSVVLRDASIVDRVWGLGYVLITLTLAGLKPSLNTAQQALTLMVTIWGLRLSLYIHFRNQGHPEDYRYAAMRLIHGERFWWYSYFSVFLLQAVLMLVVSMPLIWIMSHGDNPPSQRAILGPVIVWLTGFVFEAGGDWQLQRFKADPNNRGKLLKSGFWSWTRHPNYFGDALQWWAFGGLACTLGPGGLATLVGPAVMTLFLRKVSGVDLLEKTMRTAKPGYEDYIKSVPAFLPRWPFWVCLGALIVVIMTIA